jgi:hypothetical protein
MVQVVAGAVAVQVSPVPTAAVYEVGAIAPLSTGGSQEMTACVFPGAPCTLVGGPGRGSGVPLAAADAGPDPAALAATTVTE